MPASVIVCRCKSKIAFFTYAILAVLPVFLLGASLYGLYLHGWRIFFAGFPFAVLSGLFAFFYGVERARLKRSSLEIDLERGVIIFRHFRFVATFLPEKPREEEVVRFDEVLALQRVEAQRGIAGLRVRTTKGAVVVSEEMEHFDTIVAALSEAVSANQLREDAYRRQVQAEPKIKTAWYGWVILAAAVLIVMLIGWKTLYAD